MALVGFYFLVYLGLSAACEGVAEVEFVGFYFSFPYPKLWSTVLLKGRFLLNTGANVVG